MAFSGLTFPYFPSPHGTAKRVIDPVKVITNGTYEYRTKRARWERFMWSLATQTMTNDQKEDIRTFLSSIDHSLESFRFVDPDYPEFDDALLTYNSTTYWNLALPIATGTAGTHPIFNPILGELDVTVNGVAGAITALSIINGVPAINVTGTDSNDVVRVSGPVYFTARLNSELSYALVALDCNSNPLGHNVETLELIEVFGEY